jgi:hypothetical protein
MRGWFWVYARYDWYRGFAKRAPRDEVPLRTFYNSYTQQYEQMRLTELQQLVLQGRIQETRPPMTDGPESQACGSQRILRLI